MHRRVHLLAPLILSGLLASSFVMPSNKANAEDLKVRGNWKAYRTTSSTGKTLCGMTTVDNSTDSFYLKYGSGDAQFVGQIVKYSWHFPPYNKAIKIPLTIGVDRNPIISGNAVGYAEPFSTGGRTYQMPIVEFHLGFDKVNGFLDDISLASKMWLRFDQGSEKPWVLDMEGSAVVAIVFKGCASDLMKLSNATPPATQPYDHAAPAQPSQPSTQPYTKADPVQPSGTPTAQGDFGAI